MSTYVYSIEITKIGHKEVYEVLHLIADNIFDALTIANVFVYEQNKYPDFYVEISGVYRERKISGIINASAPVIQEDPFDLQDADESEIIRFKHTCSNEISVVDNGWDVIQCPDCQGEIKREDLEHVGGVWLYVGNKK